MAIFKVDTASELLSVNADKIFEACDEVDIHDLIELFRDEEYLTDFDLPEPTSEFDECLIALIGKKHLLTKKQEEAIIRLGKQFMV